MNYRFLLLGGALLAVTACDRGESVFKQAAEAEKAGQPDDARWQYQSIVNSYPDSKVFADAKRAYVRLSMDAAEKALSAGDVSTSQARLGEAQPHLADPADKARFKKLQAAERDTRMMAQQSKAIREFVDRIAKLANDEARAKPQVEQQAAFKWDEFVVPNLKPLQRSYLHLGKFDQVQRNGFEFGHIKRVGDGQYVLEVVANTSIANEQVEWFLQSTTNGWRVVCAQKAGESDCKDPWVYKKVKE